MSFELLKKALTAERFHLSPFLVLGDPTPDISVALAIAAIGKGAGMLELGFPYSDPCADGPAVEAADVRALAGGTSTERALHILSRIRAACPRTPLNLLVYGNLAHARGYERFCKDAVAGGASSLLVPDIPWEEGAALRRASGQAGLGHVELVGPLTSAQKLARISRDADSFLYLVAHQGVTGARDRLSAGDLVRRVVSETGLPVGLGFGLSRPEHIREAFAAGASIAVVGSHLARAIGEAWSEGGPDPETRVVSAFLVALHALVSAANEITGAPTCW